VATEGSGLLGDGWLDGAGGRPAAGSFGAVRMEASGDDAVLFSRFKSRARADVCAWEGEKVSDTKF
jgi:hypothetical protein